MAGLPDGASARATPISVYCGPVKMYAIDSAVFVLPIKCGRNASVYVKRLFQCRHRQDEPSVTDVVRLDGHLIPVRDLDLRPTSSPRLRPGRESIAGLEPLPPIRLVRPGSRRRRGVPGAVLGHDEADGAAGPAVAQRAMNHRDAVARLEGEPVDLGRAADDRRRRGTLEAPHVSPSHP